MFKNEDLLKLVKPYLSSYEDRITDHIDAMRVVLTSPLEASTISFRSNLKWFCVTLTEAQRGELRSTLFHQVEEITVHVHKIEVWFFKTGDAPNFILHTQGTLS